MNPTIHNAFSNGDSHNHPTKSLASSLSPMQAKLAETDFGWLLELSPMRAFDALRVWSHLTAQHGAGGEPVSLLFDVQQADATPIERQRASTATAQGLPIAAVADRMGIRTLDRFVLEGGDQLVLDDLSLRELVGMIQTTHLRSVLVDGPIEQRDVQAIVQAIESGHSPLEVELRAVASIEVAGDRLATLHTRSRDDALLLLAENFRHYLAALRHRPASEFSVPEPWMLQRLIEDSGWMTVRPIETSVFSTFIDVGINTSAKAEGPATRSLIYDIPSNSWHSEP